MVFKMIKKIFVILLTSTVIFTSCESTKTQSKTESTNIAAEKKENNVKEKQFIKSLENIVISSVSSPKEIIKGRNFNGSFICQVKDSNGNAISGYEINVNYPSTKENQNIQYSNIVLTSDEDGKITFTPEKPAFSCDGKVTFSPLIPNDVNESNAEVVETIKNKSVLQNYKVKSDIITKGAVLFVWDFNEKNRPLNNSYTILSELKAKGITQIGNAPVSDTDFLDKPISKLYQANYDIIGGNDFGYLLYGTIKFESPVSEVEDGYSCTLVSNVIIVEMKTGKQVFESTSKQTAVGANWNKCVSACQDKLAKTIVDQIIYGL